MSGYTKRQVNKALRFIRDHPDKRDPHMGICRNLEDLLCEVPYRKTGIFTYRSQVIKVHAPSWPKYSGNHEFPVPHPKLPATEGYHSARDMWSGKYGKLRLELLDHLIAATS